MNEVTQDQVDAVAELLWAGHLSETRRCLERLVPLVDVERAMSLLYHYERKGERASSVKVWRELAESYPAVVRAYWRARMMRAVGGVALMLATLALVAAVTRYCL